MCTHSQAFLFLFSCSVMSDSLKPHGLQHARLPCPSLSPGDCSKSHPLSQWCHPTISSSVIPFSSHLQFLPASGSFPVSQLFASGGLSIETSASASVLPMNIQGSFPLGSTGLISLLSKGLSRVPSYFSHLKSPKQGVWLSTKIMRHAERWEQTTPGQKLKQSTEQDSGMERCENYLMEI